MALLQLPISYAAAANNNRRPTHFALLSSKPKTTLNSIKPTPVSVSNSNSNSTLTFLKPFVQSQWKPVLCGWSCSAVSAYALSNLVPRLGHSSAVFAAGRIHENQALFVGVFFLLRCVSTYCQQAFLWDAALNSSYRMRLHVFRTVLERDLGFFQGGGAVSAGDIAYRLTAEAADVADTIYALLNAIVPSTLHFLAMGTQMLVISPTLSLVSALVIPCMGLAIVCIGERFRKISRKAQLSIANLSAYLNEVLPSIFFVKANSSELCEAARFQLLAQTDLSEHLKKKKMKSLIPQVVQVAYFGGLSIFFVCSFVISRGSISGSSMVSFITSLFLLVEPIQGVEKAYNEWKQAEPAIERMLDLTRFKPQVIEKPEAYDLECVTGELKFFDISFRYGDNMPLVLNGLNLHIRAGETVAFVGPSGGGKTTLVKLILRLYDPLHGSVLVDSHNIQNIRLESLRRHIGLVSQDTMLFSGTVAENIGYRDLMGKIDMERVELAARNANVDEFVRSLPLGYKTNIGPRGSSLSGGQRQRLAIARALYQNSSILILDEATSALDSKSELLVRQALERMMKNHTVLVIAHRLETVLMANRVFLLKEGKLEELSRSSLLGDLQYSPESTGFAI